jgi:hypothetical protein
MDVIQLQKNSKQSNLFQCLIFKEKSYKRKKKEGIREKEGKRSFSEQKEKEKKKKFAEKEKILKKKSKEKERVKKVKVFSLTKVSFANRTNQTKLLLFKVMTISKFIYF